MELGLTAAQRYATTRDLADGHAGACRRCLPPSLDRRWGGCPDGRRLEQELIRDWRARVDALTDRRLH